MSRHREYFDRSAALNHAEAAEAAGIVQEATERDRAGLPAKFPSAERANPQGGRGTNPGLEYEPGDVVSGWRARELGEAQSRGEARDLKSTEPSGFDLSRPGAPTGSDKHDVQFLMWMKVETFFGRVRSMRPYRLMLLDGKSPEAMKAFADWYRTRPLFKVTEESDMPTMLCPELHNMPLAQAIAEWNEGNPEWNKGGPWRRVPLRTAQEAAKSGRLAAGRPHGGPWETRPYEIAVWIALEQHGGFREKSGRKTGRNRTIVESKPDVPDTEAEVRGVEEFRR